MTMSPRVRRRMLRLGLRYQIMRRMRVRLFRNASLIPAVKPLPRYVNNNAIVGPAWRRYMRKINAKFPLP